jgi:Zn-dependent protease
MSKQTGARRFTGSPRYFPFPIGRLPVHSLPTAAYVVEMLYRVIAAVGRGRPSWRSAVRRLTWRRGAVSALARRLGQFWLVWSALLLVHEAGHAVGAWHQGLEVLRITAGVGPVVWRGSRGETEVVLRLVPVAGLTTFGRGHTTSAKNDSHSGGGWTAWGRELSIIAGGAVATLALGFAVAVVVALWERGTGRRWRWGRYVVADALVLTLFNFLPVPPLDGGRAVIGAVVAWRGAGLTADTLFWVQFGGLALAIIPMVVWTRWTKWIDARASWWGAPEGR